MSYLDRFFSLSVWTSDSKSSLVAGPITAVENVDVQESVMDPAVYTFSLKLEDKTAANLARGSYFELLWGNPGYQTLCVNGYLETVTRHADLSDSYQVVASDSLRALTVFRDTVLEMPATSPIYTDILSRINGVPDSTGSYPPGHKGILTGSGQTVEWLDAVNHSSPPGLGDGWTDDWPDGKSALDTFAEHYNFFYRRKVGVVNYGHNGHIQAGPLNDDSGCHIWGGPPLVADMAANHGYAGKEVNAAYAQQYGYALINSASYQESLGSIHNLVWAIGKGDPTKKGVTLRSLAGGPPADANNNAINGWTKWQPHAGGQLFFVKTASKTTYQGHTYEFVATQDNEGAWMYGVVDRTSVALYDVCQYSLVEKKISEPNWLLSAALGHLEYNASPIPQWTFAVKHPGTLASGVPAIAAPGQKLNVHYQGKTLAAPKIDTDTGSATYGQQISAGSYIWMDYPGSSDTAAQQQLQRLMNVDWTWDASSGFEVTYTLGQGKWKPHAAMDNVARQMERNTTARPHHTKFVKGHIEGVPFLYSRSPNAYEDAQLEVVNMEPGSTVVSDVPNASFFDDHHEVKFTALINDNAQYLDFWFAKAVNANLQSPNAGVVYGIFRLAMPGSGVSTWIYTTSDGVNFTRRGVIPHPTLVGNIGPGQYSVSVHWSGGTYTVHLGDTDTDIHDGVHAPFLAAKWADKKVGGQQVIQAWGAIGWKLHGGSNIAVLSAVHAAPHRRKSRAVRGGKGKRHVMYAEIDPGDGSGSGGLEHRTLDEVAGTSELTHLIGSRGKAHHTNDHQHGPHSPNRVKVASVTGAGPWTVYLAGDNANPITPGGLKTGWTVQLADGSGKTVQVASLLYGNDYGSPTSTLANGKWIVGFVTASSAGGSIIAGGSLFWDLLAQSDQPQGGHRITGVYKTWTDTRKTLPNGQPNPDYNKKKEGWAQAHIAADAHGSHDLAFYVYPDGSYGSGHEQHVSSDGKAQKIQEMIVDGEQFAKGLETHGHAFFDAGEYESSTQAAYTYSGSSGTRTGTYGPNSAGFYGGTPGTGNPVCWVSNTVDNSSTGEADSVLAVHADAGTTTAWHDTQIVEEPSTPGGTPPQRKIKVSKNVSKRIPIYIDSTSQTSTGVTLGSTALLAQKILAGIPNAIVNHKPSNLATSAGDQWTIDPGTSIAETFTVGSTSDVLQQLTATGNFAHDHDPGATLHMTKTAGGQQVDSGATLDGNAAFDETKVNANINVMVSFWDGTNWYRAWWGDPSATWPQVNDTGYPGYNSAGNTLKFVGPLRAAIATWTDFVVKASDIGLWTAGAAPITIVGIELAVQGRATVYFDAHSYGFVSSKTQQKAGSVTPGALAQMAVKLKHLDPFHHSDAHQHSEITFWHVANTLFWTTGEIINHDGVTAYAINGTTEDGPQGGMSTLVGSQSSGAGNYILFNSTGSAVSINDPTYGTVTIPAYSPSGGGFGQSTGFGVVSQAYKFHARVSGANVKGGLPPGVYKVAKIGKTPDTYTGELGVQTKHGSGKQHGKNVRKGAVGKKHNNKHHPGVHHHHGINMSTSNTTASAPYTCSLALTAGTISMDDGSTVTVTAQTLNSVPAEGIIAYDLNVTNGFGVAFLASGTNMSTDANAHYAVMTRISAAPDPHTLQLTTEGWHAGSHQVHGKHVQTSALARKHSHKHNSHKHHHTGITYQTLQLGGTWNGSTLTANQCVVGIKCMATGTALHDDSGNTIVTIFPSNPALQAAVSVSPSGGNPILAGQGQWLVYNGGSASVTDGSNVVQTGQLGALATVNGSDDANIAVYIIGKISSDTDATSGLPASSGHHAGAHQHHGKHVSNGAVAQGHMNYGLAFDWTAIGGTVTLNPVNVNDPGTVRVSAPQEVTLTPPVNIKRLHAGDWTSGVSPVGNSAPDTSSITHVYSSHPTNLESDLVVGSIQYGNASVLSNGLGAILVNRVSRDIPNNLIRLKYQWVNNEQASETLQIWVRWHGHAKD